MAEGYEGAGRNIAIVLGQPPVGVETFRMGEQVAAVVEDEGTVGEGGSRREGVTAQKRVGGSGARDEPGGRVQPQSFRDDPTGELETGHVFICGHTAL